MWDFAPYIEDGEPAPLDAQELVVELAPVLGIPTRWCRPTSRRSPAPWPRPAGSSRTAGCGCRAARADYQEVEAAMTEGHHRLRGQQRAHRLRPRRLHRLRPEAGRAVRLVWLAARRSATRLSLGAGLSEERLWAGELDPEVRAGFAARLARAGPGPRRLHLPAAAPLAVAQQGRGPPSPPTSPGATSCTSARAPTPTGPSSRSARSSTPTAPSGTTSRPPWPSRTWASCGASPPPTWPSPPPSTTGWPTSSPATPRWPAAASRCCASARRSATPATPSTATTRHLALPQDARGAVAREPAAADRSR